MATLYENHNTGDEGQLTGWDTYGVAQTFPVLRTHKITSVKLKLWRDGSPGTITASIRAASEGLPTGDDLCSGTTEGNTLPEEEPGEWREITLGAGAVLEVGAQYAIVVFSAAEHPALFFWRISWNGDKYDGGNASYGGNGSWTIDPTEDCMFEEWGDPIINSAISLGQVVTATRKVDYIRSAEFNR